MASEDTLNLDFIKELLASSDEIPEEKFNPEDSSPEGLDLTGDAEAVIPEEEYRDPLIRKFAQVSQGQRSIPEETPEQIDEEPEEKRGNLLVRFFGFLGKTAITLAALALTALLVTGMVLIFGNGTTSSAGAASDVTIMDKFDMFMTNQVSNALDGVLSIEKVYWLSDTDLVAPEPNPAGYGTAASAAELGWLLEEAKDLIGGQDMLFSTETQIWEEDQIYYYYDETILVITWKEVIDNCTYTISEVKIAHPSQFRRFLADGTFGSDKQYVTTEMASSVNAVVASSGDFYKFRRNGIVVYEGNIQRFETRHADSCYINEDGDLLFTYRNQIADIEEAEQFVKDNKVRFSLAFGPILVDNGVECAPASYALGEIDGFYSRMALCQRDDLHYLLINSTAERDSQKRHTIKHFAQIVADKGCDKAYALDGGQTTVITMDDKYINDVDYGFQRQISDIIYFATALPNGE